MISIALNVFQFVFKEASNRDGVMQGRPWLLDNQLMVLQIWEESKSWKDYDFSKSPIWIQVWHVPIHWLSIETGRNIGGMLGYVHDMIIMDAGERDERHLKIQVEVDLTKPLVRGTMLKYKMVKCWVEFRYEQLPTFYFYCGIIWHNEKMCAKRKGDLAQISLVFG